MVTTTDNGITSADWEIALLCVGQENVPREWRRIKPWLEKQPESWASEGELLDMFDMLAEGSMSAFLFMEKDVDIGLCLYSVQQYACDKMALRLEFLSCERFFGEMKFFKGLEALARGIGCEEIEAISHPTLAKYAMKKCGFTSPGVFIRKSLNVGRRN